MPDAPHTEPPTNDKDDLKAVQIVQMKCKFAENIGKELSSEVPEVADRAKVQLESVLKTCLATAQATEDTFCRSAMLHSIADLLSELAGRWVAIDESTIM